MDAMKVTNIEVDGIDPRDNPDFVDAFISYAEDENGNKLTEEQLDKLNSDDSFVYDCVMKHLY